ncbi:MAG: hypothetical protein A3J93_05360 [Candidatus Magasanikbacteria bacterium RIFOXYC2_FULL_42_28]|uniref:Uncharacterized protein n=1 Tax=Candidatus Magasanikbacteria bacterium RIFOXYC2_FULL_42_28 TaxID=1798704 RepID=A0A1F6NV82_9BACT|nr:MAG: hypothetical protein A3J93_05360 [Candidatus Magasanikbacteria bacterium RIFOXYC2_FULL_42_28]
MQKNTKNKQDVTSLFKAVGIPGRFIITATNNTYEIDALEPKNNWLYPAFRGFQNLSTRLTKENKPTDTFVAIGTGQGLDAVGAYHILKPKNIIITDLHPAVVPITEKNFYQNIKNGSAAVMALTGNLCEPLRQNKITADIIYANLPNIPLSEADTILSGQLTSTFFDASRAPHSPSLLNAYLLGLQNAFLQDAHASLAPGGSVIINLGGRVPIALIQTMFADAGYTYQELYATFKLQTQPEWVLGGYARAEEKYKKRFDFYRYDAASARLGTKIFEENISAVKLKKLLEPFLINATSALKRCVYDHERVGHVVQIIRGLKKN